MKFSSPRIEVGSIITTFRSDLKGVTPKRKYIVQQRDSEMIMFKNDDGVLMQYRSIFFMESDVIFSLLMFMTINRLLNFEKK